MPGAPFICLGFRSNVISFGKINVVVIVVVVVVVVAKAPSDTPTYSMQLPKGLMPIVERKRSGM